MGQQREDNAPRLGTALLYPRAGAPSTVLPPLFSVATGGFGVDFSKATEDVGSGVALVARRLLSHGVTSFCPTLVTSPPEVYHKVR